MYTLNNYINNTIMFYTADMHYIDTEATSSKLSSWIAAWNPAKCAVLKSIFYFPLLPIQLVQIIGIAPMAVYVKTSYSVY